MASTPAVGPSPTTRTKTSAHTSSGMLRSTMSSQRTAWRSQNGPRAMRPDSADTDSTRVDSSVSGNRQHQRQRHAGGGDGHRAPGLARHHAPGTRRASTGGQKLPMNCALIAGCRLQQHPGLELGGHPSGHSSTSAAPVQKTRPARPDHGASQARGAAACEALIGSASPPAAAPGWRVVGRRRGVAAQFVFVLAYRRASRSRVTWPPAGRRPARRRAGR
jgi:hypothetical protein